jgi:cyclase
MPLSYGGGVRDLYTAMRLVQVGVEKVMVNALTVEDPEEVRRMTDRLGASTIVASIDALAVDGRFVVATRNATQPSGLDVRTHAEAVQGLGVGEIFLNAIHRDGTMEGYDLELIRQVTSAVGVPVVACGGARSLDDLAVAVLDGGAAAAAAGSLFVFYGRHRAVLITYPTYAQRVALFRGTSRSDS